MTDKPTADERMRAWIDGASYEDLLRKWRFSPSGDPMLMGEVGTYYKTVMDRRGLELSAEERVAISKRIGWERL
jgi:hypothetical protein